MGDVSNAGKCCQRREKNWRNLKEENRLDGRKSLILGGSSTRKE